MKRTVVERGNEASARALRATSGMLAKVGAAHDFYKALQQSYWGQYKTAYDNAMLDMEDEE
jgi:hypothetical protein